MSDENQVDEVIDNEQAPNPVETEARASGWVPKDEFHGDEFKWVDADEFVRRAPLFKKIDIQTRELKEVKKTLDMLKVHHSQVRETEYKRALAELKAAKKEAYIEGNPDEILEIDDKIELVKDEQRKFEATQKADVEQTVTADIHPEFQAWMNRNTWYENSKPMKAYADAVGIELRQSGMAPSEVLKRVEILVKEEFPNKFRNANRDKANSVEDTSKRGGGKNDSGAMSLTEEERRVMQRFVRQNIMTEKDYIAELKKVKGA